MAERYSLVNERDGLILHGLDLEKMNGKLADRYRELLDALRNEAKQCPSCEGKGYVEVFKVRGDCVRCSLMRAAIVRGSLIAGEASRVSPR